MTANELEIAFIERCERQNLKQQATDMLGKIIADPSNNDAISYLRGYHIQEINCVFDGFRLHTLDRFLGTRIRCERCMKSARNSFRAEAKRQSKQPLGKMPTEFA